MNIRKMSFIALFIALSVIGAAIKIPAIIGSVALDVFPALLAGAFFGAVPGAIVGGFGHMVSALIGGMPLGPLHFIVAISMALLVYIFAILFRHGKRALAFIVFVIGNTLIAPLPFMFILDVAFYIALVPSLFVGSLFNVIIAWLMIPRLVAVFQGAYQKGEAKG
ncbi:ECF transporter S component [Oceanobacillus sp. Castelsardo]|uniref:ECF transporter S component n=1 Tax=Oceanobacillus sp. Castelsardo TaxID=1851204 RepID=UPI000A6D1E58|nr:ECF transporter S component [Oceanobacillus sp. Castelsardo]